MPEIVTGSWPVTANVSRSAMKSSEDSLRRGDEGSEDIEAALSGGGNNGSQAREFDGAFESAKSAGDFHLHFHHSQVLFGQIVREGHIEVGEKAERFVFIGLEAYEQVLARALLLSAASLWRTLDFGELTVQSQTLANGRPIAFLEGAYLLRLEGG